MKLDVDERARLAVGLIESLEGEPKDDLATAWALELERRLRDIDAGTEKLVSWDEVRDRIDRTVLRR